MSRGDLLTVMGDKQNKTDGRVHLWQSNESLMGPFHTQADS